jgi:Tol biopolymer transport system component
MARISPDGRRVAADFDGQVWLYDLARATLTRLTFEGTANLRPVWTPDGERIAFASDRDRQQNILWQLADGSGGLERLASSEYPQIPVSFSPDGQFLSFYEVHPNTQRDIWILNVRERKAQPFLQTRFNETGASFSPDGHWLAYASDESGRAEVYVQAFPGPGAKWQVSAEGGDAPVWNRNGRELFYRSGDKVMAVRITAQPAFVAERPQEVFAREYAQPVLIAPYDVSADGQRFLMLKPAEEEAAGRQIVIVQNWFEELKRLAPAGK